MKKKIYEVYEFLDDIAEETQWNIFTMGSFFTSSDFKFRMIKAANHRYAYDESSADSAYEAMSSIWSEFNTLYSNAFSSLVSRLTAIHNSPLRSGIVELSDTKTTSQTTSATTNIDSSASDTSSSSGTTENEVSAFDSASYQDNSKDTVSSQVSSSGSSSTDTVASGSLSENITNVKEVAKDDFENIVRYAKLNTEIDTIKDMVFETFISTYFF